jgi:hypothetical protein
MEDHTAADKENSGEDVKQQLLTKLLGSGLLNSVKVGWPAVCRCITP